MANSNVTKSFSLSLMSSDTLTNEIDLLVLVAFISTLHLQNFTSRYFDMIEDNLWIKTSNELLMKLSIFLPSAFHSASKNWRFKLSLFKLKPESSLESSSRLVLLINTALPIPNSIISSSYTVKVGGKPGPIGHS